LQFIYNVFISLLSLVATPYIVLKSILSDRAYLNLLGIYAHSKDRGSNERSIWIHASSVGEVKAALIVLNKIRESDPAARIVLTVFTPRGMKIAREEIPHGTEIYYLPIDIPTTVSRAYRRFNPGLLLLTETELWPNLIEKAFEHDIPVMIVNGRLSERSFARYMSLRNIFSPLLDRIEYVHAQSPEDAERFRMLGVRDESLHHGENIKIAGMFSSLSKFDRAAVMSEFKFDATDRIIVCGSTRPGEEEIILNAFGGIRTDHKNVKLLFAPRHLDRVGEVEHLITQRGLTSIRRTRLDSSDSHDFDVMILDTLGELWKLYGIGVAAFVGGSLVPVGGHNPLEPVALGVPTCFGPYMDNCRLLADRCLHENIAVEVSNADEFENFVNRCLKGLCRMPDSRELERMFSSDINDIVSEIIARWRSTNA